MQEKDGIVRRNSQLQDSDQSLRNIRNVAQKQIASHIISHCQTNAGQENKRDCKRIRGQNQHQERKKACHHNIAGNLFHCQILNVCNNSAHTADKALLPHLGTHLFNGFHGRLCRCGLIEQCDHHGGIPLKQSVRHRTRNHADRHVDPHKIIVPQHLFHMVHRLDPLLQCRNILLLHPVYYDHGECTHTEFIDHDILPGHGLQRIRQITQNIIVDFCGNEPERRWDQKQKCSKYNERLTSCNKFSYPFHLPHLSDFLCNLSKNDLFSKMTTSHFYHYMLYYRNDH